jgi:hypothetical protein
MNRVIVTAHHATQPGGIGSLVSILVFLKSLKIRALYCYLGYKHLKESLQGNVAKSLTGQTEGDVVETRVFDGGSAIVNLSVKMNRYHIR